MSSIDAFAERAGTSRPEAIRRLIELALGAATLPPKHVARMAPLKSEPPGMERDSGGHAIPMKERLPEDRAKAKRAKKPKGTTRKNEQLQNRPYRTSSARNLYKNRERAALMALMRADELLARGEAAGCNAWKRIVKAIYELERTMPGR